MAWKLINGQMTWVEEPSTTRTSTPVTSFKILRRAHPGNLLIAVRGKTYEVPASGTSTTVSADTRSSHLRKEDAKRSAQLKQVIELLKAEEAGNEVIEAITKLWMPSTYIGPALDNSDRPYMERVLGGLGTGNAAVNAVIDLTLPFAYSGIKSGLGYLGNTVRSNLVGAYMNNMATPRITTNNPKVLFTKPSGRLSNLTWQEQLFAMSPQILQNYPNLLTADGEPLIVFHGTDLIFDKFDPATWRYGALGKGFYFGKGNSVFRHKPLQIEAMVNIKNPLKLTNSRREILFEDSYYNNPELGGLSPERIRLNGHSGVIVDYGKESGKPAFENFELTVYNPDDILITKKNGVLTNSTIGNTRPVTEAYVNKLLHDPNSYYHGTSDKLNLEPFDGAVTEGKSFYDTSYPNTNFYKLHKDNIQYSGSIKVPTTINVNRPGNYYYFQNPNTKQWFETSYKQGGKLNYEHKNKETK